MGVSCTAERAGGPAREASTGVHELTSLYEKASEPRRRAVRKPIREQRERAMDLLAVKADEMLAEANTWDSDARLTAVGPQEQGEARQAAESLRNSLACLRDAAHARNLGAIRSEYTATMDSYQRLIQVLGPFD